jgi:hypothetical protein
LNVGLAAAKSPIGRTALGRNDSSASGSLRASSLQRRLSGDESDWAAVAGRPVSDTRIAELEARKRSIYLRVNPATTVEAAHP